MHTLGVHHLGLTVHDVEIAGRFFVDALGFQLIERKDHPAVFVTDGVVMITLWSVRGTNEVADFDRYAAVGLHHLALRVASAPALDAAHQILRSRPDVVVEFEPRPLGTAGARHMMFAGPSGVRIELIAP